MKVFTVQIGNNYSTRITVKKRTGNKTRWYNSLKKASLKYKYSYRQLVIRERVRRVEEVSMIVLSGCVEKTILKSDGHLYLLYNKDLAVDAITLLDCIRNRVRYELKVKMWNVCEKFTPLFDQEEE